MKTTFGRLLLWFLGVALVVAFVILMSKRAMLPALLEYTPPDRGGVGVRDVLFYVLAGVTVLGAAGVALSRNILYTSLGLLIALLGAGSLYVFLSADFVAVTQLLVYIGGVLVLILFAVMLTNRITDIEVSNTSFGKVGGVLLFVSAFPVLLAVVLLTPWKATAGAQLAPTTQAIGDAFLSTWLLPFEVASLVLLATLIGAVVIARKEVKAD